MSFEILYNLNPSKFLPKFNGHCYIVTLKDNAEVAVQDMLKEIARKTLLRTGTTTLYAEDFLDDGAKLCLHVNISMEVS